MLAKWSRSAVRRVRGTCMCRRGGLGRRWPAGGPAGGSRIWRLRRSLPIRSCRFRRGSGGCGARRRRGRRSRRRRGSCRLRFPAQVVPAHLVWRHPLGCEDGADRVVPAASQAVHPGNVQKIAHSALGRDGRGVERQAGAGINRRLSSLRGARPGKRRFPGSGWLALAWCFLADKAGTVRPVLLG